MHHIFLMRENGLEIFFQGSHWIEKSHKKYIHNANNLSEYENKDWSHIYVHFAFVLGSWKDPNNDFKKTLKLTGVPTLLRYGTVNMFDMLCVNAL